ncbi:MAG TPA: methyltransferase domain-containing protein [Candidatus Dormibacteraeota bacterium]|jgi:trans-aconitate methyltransferase|nr:methyltransferase domain-containing protein [Candidatus Dormibacteraeota bacterium]
MSLSDWDGTTYHRVSEPQLAWGRRVLARLDLRGDETVLDAGCGSGRLTAELAERLPRGRVIALDQSPSMLAVARGELEPRLGERISFVCADLLDLDLDAAVDVVFSTATFHWVLDHPRLFAGLHRALRPGGRLLVQCGGGPNLERIHGRALRLLGAPEFAGHSLDWSTPWEFAGAGTTRQRLETAGFVDIDTSVEPAPTVLGDRDAYREFLATVIMRPFLARLPDGGLRDRLLDAMCDAGAADDPAWSLDYWRLNMAARRPISG